MNIWDDLAQYFEGDNSDSADNVEIIEPIVIKELKKIKNLKIIDFGCGSGNFCRRISSFSKKILGTDSSKEMIKIANIHNKSKNIEYTTKQIFDLDIKDFNTFNATAVLQFLEDAELVKLIEFLADSNIKNIFIANDNVDMIEDVKEAKSIYKFKANKLRYTIQLGEKEVEIIPRHQDEYAGFFEKAGFELVNSFNPHYPKSFLEKYPKFKDFPDRPVFTILHLKRKQ